MRCTFSLWIVLDSKHCPLCWGWLGRWRTELLWLLGLCICALNVLPLPCRASMPGQAEVTLPSFPQLSRLDFAWLMNCDRTQLQGCLCSYFVCQASWRKSVKDCSTLMMTLTFVSAMARLRAWHTPVHTWRSPTVRLRTAQFTTKCLYFNSRRRV